MNNLGGIVLPTTKNPEDYILGIEVGWELATLIKLFLIIVTIITILYFIVYVITKISIYHTSVNINEYRNKFGIKISSSYLSDTISVLSIITIAAILFIIYFMFRAISVFI